MPYVKHNYQSGDILTAQSLNEMDEQIFDLTEEIGVLEPAATPQDAGKFLKAKTVYNGKVVEYEFGSASGGGGGGGTSDYDELDNRPSLNGIILTGNKTTSNVGIHDIPSGGTAGQVLSKASGTDYDVEWTDQSGGAEIDDTAGDGDTDKVWSADKLVSELSEKYEKPSGGIPATDIASGVIPDVSGFYTKPSGGIPATDIASGVIPDPEDLIDDTAGDGDTDKVWSADKTVEEIENAVDGYVKISTTQPTEPSNKLWIEEDAEENYSVPSYAEFAALEAVVDTLNDGGLDLKDSVIQQEIDDWLDGHPEATTTVQDGAITRAKLDSNLQGIVDDVGDLNSALDSISIFRFEDAVQKKLIDTSGNVSNNNSYAYKYIPYIGGTIEIAGTTGSGIINYFDSSDAFIQSSGWKNLTGYIVDETAVPAGTTKLSVSFSLSDINTIIVYENKLSKIGDLERELNTVNVRFEKIAIFTVEDAVQKKYINREGEEKTDNSYAYKFFPYTAGAIEITGATGNGIINYYNSSDTLLQSTSWVSLVNKFIDAESIPSGTTKIAISFPISNISTLVIYSNKLTKANEAIARVDKTDSRLDHVAAFTCDGAIIGKYISSSGTIDNNSSMAYVYIPYYAGDIKIIGATDTGIISYWNADKTTQLGNTGWTTKLNTTIIEPFIPTGTKYIGLSFHKDDVSSILVYSGLFAKIGRPDNIHEVIALDNSRHIPRETIAPLTILHFSDLHKDTSALTRITHEASKFGTSIDDMICTGDIVSNTYEQIASWWNPNVMTCIGNHDTASYTQGVGYDWTALSMANRSAYYIEPFESGWGITHTAGTSYYYKDYTDQNVRLIVMDAMLYNDNGTDATDQTTWLSGLLASAITSDLHVLIAIHAPHGGATAKECSFSRYEQTAMQSSDDCNTPQSVIDAVSSAISNGLHFIGYLIGHTHQDNIWDAESDGKQLMYCITCACVVQKPQWIKSDQHRSDIEDAYNLVTIDTANTLVKIVRCGGANMDDHMRTRKAICFNYSTGEIVGEVL